MTQPSKKIDNFAAFINCFFNIAMYFKCKFSNITVTVAKYDSEILKQRANYFQNFSFKATQKEFLCITNIIKSAQDK